MLYRIADIQEDVRTTLDQNADSGPLLITKDIDTLSLDDIIASKVEDAAKAVEMICPLHLLHGGHVFGDTVYWGEAGSGMTILPDDFARLIAFRMSDWERTVHIAIAETDSLYSRQSSRWKGLRGTPQRPVCAIVPGAEGLTLEFYSCRDEDATVERALYLPTPKTEDGAIDLCERCYRPIVYYTSGLAAQTLGMETASVFFELSKSLLI